LVKVTASEMTRLWHQACQNAGLGTAIIPYALRHSSIVRGLRMGLHIRLVAAIHDTSVTMIERHYSRWITEGLDELAARDRTLAGRCVAIGLRFV
jgi:site-specific recombinase XerD